MFTPALMAVFRHVYHESVQVAYETWDEDEFDACVESVWVLAGVEKPSAAPPIDAKELRGP